jgi:hypothetical protein
MLRGLNFRTGEMTPELQGVINLDPDFRQS